MAPLRFAAYLGPERRSVAGRAGRIVGGRMIGLDEGLAAYDAPAALLIGDDARLADSYQALLVDSGARVVGRLAPAEAIERLARQVNLDLLVVALADDHPIHLDQILAMAGRLTGGSRCAVIAELPLSLADRALAHLVDDRAQILCDADACDRLTAVALALGEPMPMLMQETRELENLRLKRLADEINRIARTLSSLSATGLQGEGQPAGRPSQGNVSDAMVGFAAEPSAAALSPVLPPADVVRKAIRVRRMRDSFFDPQLFADPAWDMLLDLFAAHIEGEQVAVSSLCIAAAVPPTTALRWIKTMTDAGLFVRDADPGDGRRVFIGLSDKAVDALASYFAAVRRFEGAIL